MFVSFSHRYFEPVVVQVMSSRGCLMIDLDDCLGRKPCCSFLGIYIAYFGILTRMTLEKIRDKIKNLFSSRGCLGCCTKPQLITAVDQPSKGLKIQGRAVKRTGLSEDIWSSSTYEMDNNSAVQSQRSISSMSTSNQNLDPNAASGSTSNPSEFVNHGLLLWNQMRQQWIGDRKTRSQPKTPEPKLSWNATYGNLLGTNKPFPQPIPLPEMVDFLVDVWEQDGLYD